MCFLPESCIWNVSKVLEIYSISEYQRNYFNNDRPRENFQIRTWTRDCKWFELTEEERILAGEKRASLHNKSIEYDFSFLENVALFNDFIKYCTERKINVLIVITPATQYYRAFLNERFIEIFYEVLNRCTGLVHLIDLYESKLNGASVLLYDGLLAKFAEKVGGDFYILSSSIHETILLPASGDMDVDYLIDMVRSINALEVSPEEILSDNVYKYLADKDRVEMM